MDKKNYERFFREMENKAFNEPKKAIRIAAGYYIVYIPDTLASRMTKLNDRFREINRLESGEWIIRDWVGVNYSDPFPTLRETKAALKVN